MAASRSMLESLLARVRQRANEPRQPSLVAPAVVIPRLSTPRFDLRAPAPAAKAPPAYLVEDEIEEYDEELIEIIDDVDVLTAETPPEARPLELRASAPSVEMRRRVIAPSSRANGALAPSPASPLGSVRVPAAAPPARSVPLEAVPLPEPLRAEVVSRKPVAPVQVAQSQGARRDLRAVPFVELLDTALKLGS